MTHKDYERAVNHWKPIDAASVKMNPDKLKKEIDKYIAANKTCALAAGRNGLPKRNKNETNHSVKWCRKEERKNSRGNQSIYCCCCS